MQITLVPALWRLTLITAPGVRTFRIIAPSWPSDGGTFAPVWRKKGSAEALPKPKVGQNTGQKADALRSTSPNATIMRSNFFDLTKATAAIRLHFDKFRNPVHIVQAHDHLEKPFHFIRF